MLGYLNVAQVTPRCTADLTSLYLLVFPYLKQESFLPAFLKTGPISMIQARHPSEDT